MLCNGLHPARLIFRKTLLTLMGFSVLFLLFVVALRINYRDGHIDGAVQVAVFEYDVLQHKARALIADDETDMQIINELIQLSFFSPIYTRAGFEMLVKKADKGYEPAIAQLASLENQGIQVRR